jgi:enoyl-CoA hydratase/carnithine racemase
MDAARRYFLTGDRISATEAERLGLINRLCATPLEDACDLASAIAGGWSAEAIVAAKEACQLN